MAETIDELTIEYKEDDLITVKELAKEILTRGAWTTIMYQYQDLDKKTGEYGPIKYSIRRYQKRNGQYMAKSKFNISSDEQARQMIAILTQWIEAKSAEA